jgi:hypothetical protein
MLPGRTVLLAEIGPAHALLGHVDLSFERPATGFATARTHKKLQSAIFAVEWFWAT